jgi:O6-methylguanine-DNA--protein-cysteine methyltransferase
MNNIAKLAFLVGTLETTQAVAAACTANPVAFI